MCAQVPAVHWLRDDRYGEHSLFFSLLIPSCETVPKDFSGITQNDFPQLKYALLGGLGLLALVQRE